MKFCFQKYQGNVPGPGSGHGSQSLAQQTKTSSPASFPLPASTPLPPLPLHSRASSNGPQHGGISVSRTLRIAEDNSPGSPTISQRSAPLLSALQSLPSSQPPSSGSLPVVPKDLPLPPTPSNANHSNTRTGTR